MKKLVLSLLLLVNTVFGITLAQIDLGTHPRAFITQVDIRDSRDLLTPPPLLLTKLNTVTYQYWYSSYPYSNMKYNGKILDWWYTFDYDIFYTYSTDVDFFLHPNDLSVTYVYINLNGYSSGQLDFYYFESGQKIKFHPTLTHVSGTIWAFKQIDSSHVNGYLIDTFIQASDGTAKLGNDLIIDRNIK